MWKRGGGFVVVAICWVGEPGWSPPATRRKETCALATVAAIASGITSCVRIAADFGVRPTDLDGPFIDELTRSNPDDPTGKSTMRRVPEVLDCWFERVRTRRCTTRSSKRSGSSTVDFIVEYVA
jgi:isoleucyl-tRNA synthetase